MADRSEFDNVAIACLDSVYRVALALCGRQAEAEDLAQETFTKPVNGRLDAVNFHKVNTGSNHMFGSVVGPATTEMQASVRRYEFATRCTSSAVTP